jgi:GMP synthase-like glutamine amidotransferase
MSPTPSVAPLRVGLLQCGHIHPDLVPTHGDYPEAFADLLAGMDIELVTYDVTVGPPPSSVRACDAWLVSGSASSAYEPLAWIPPVEDFLRAIVEAEAPLVAVCFGHQLLAQAMGGRVARSEAGWGVGAHDYELVGDAPAWMTDVPATGRVRLIASHQDQVVELPDGAVVIARTDHCPVAAYTLGPRALAIQPHPEFTPAVSRGLVERRYEVIGPERADAALATLDAPLDRALVGRWMARFLGSPV